jgi:hypothetical protein
VTAWVKPEASPALPLCFSRCPLCPLCPRHLLRNGSMP